MKKFLEDLCEAMMGGNSLGHAGLVVATCEEHEQPELGWQEALELLQEKDYEIDECPRCGWVSEGNFYEHSEYPEGVCYDCQEKEEDE